jgi:hypothetical protein
MQQIIRQYSAGSVATVNADGTPAVSPKATFVVVDSRCIAALEKGMPFPAGRALFQVTWDALYPSILGCSTTR